MRYEVKAGEAIHWLPEENGYPVSVKAEIDLEITEEHGERWVRPLHPRDHGKTMIWVNNPSSEVKTLKADMPTSLIGVANVLPITEHRADLCADPALLAEAVEVLGYLLSDVDDDLASAQIARAFIAKLEARHE